MKSRRIPSVLMPLGVALIACQPGAGPLSEEDVAAIRNLLATYEQAALSGDWDTWSGIWTEDAVYMVPNSPAIRGREAIEASVAGPVPQEFTVTIDEIDGRGDLAFVRGSFALTMVFEGEAEPVEEAGKSLWIVRQQPDGTWLVAVECYNSDLPVPQLEVEHSEG
jgi:uncharacterized protein (TIGR02246 family)